MSFRRIAAVFAVCGFFAVHAFDREWSWGVSGALYGFIAPELEQGVHNP